MNKKRFLSLVIFMIFSLCFVSCGEENNNGELEYNEQEILDKLSLLDKEGLTLSIKLNDPKDSVSKIDLYNINDFHGAIEEDTNQYGITRIIEYLANEYNKNSGGTVIGLNGDLFQGSALSNLRHGLDIINILNTIPVDYMVLGNHEFDWGLEEILKYFDGNKENGEANFPLLACNVSITDSNKSLGNIKPYTILEKGEYKIGVIGYIGYGLEKDISNSKVAGYKFLEPSNIVKNYAKELRDAGCDMVVVSGHDDNDSANSSFASFTNEYRIDCIFNGHTHLTYERILKSNGRSIPLIQSGNVGKYVGHVTLEKSGIDWNPTLVTNQKLSYYDANTDISNYVAKIIEITSPMFQRVLTYAGMKIGRYDCIDFVCDSLKEYTNSDIVFYNPGGIRANAFPINNGDAVTISKCYEIIPFDNFVKKCVLKGSDIYSLLNGDLSHSTNVSNYKINGEDIVLNKEYIVSTIDYVFDQSAYPFSKGSKIEYLDVTSRDILIEALKAIGTDGKWKC